MQFQPLCSVVEPSFWHHLANLKLNVLKLDDAPVPVSASLAPGRAILPTSTVSLSTSPPDPVALPASLSLAGPSLDPPTFPKHAPAIAPIAPGTLKNTNTVEDFKRLDKPALFHACARQVWDDIVSGKALADPTLLLRFLLVTFADLKKHKFFYWFAFPAISATSAFPTGVTTAVKTQSNLLEHVGTVDRVKVLAQGFRQHAREFAYLVDDATLAHAPLAHLPEWVQQGKPITVVFADAAALPTNPSWSLRNLLVLLAHHGVTHCTVIAARHDLTADTEKHPGTLSRVWQLDLAPTTAAVDSTDDPEVKATGWERTLDGKLAPRSVDLAHMMDPKRLAEDAVHLNLKLMKWRVLPTLDLDAISSARCLLLGAGTLGCYVARSLLAWGVKHVTFVDYGKVSFSNPVRQPLFTFEDCLHGGKDKAVAAAQRAKEILPTLNATGYALSIPMPGHPVLNEAQFQETMVQLDALFQAHDVVYLLMDSRESRWLPTLLGKVHGKIVINAALGFDSYVVMRHSDTLGCYFCNDVVAPTDSLSDRTLDQMCTVTRPGLAAIAGASSVELMASVLNHTQRNAAPALSQSALGTLPHQLRGFLGTHETMLITGQAYDQCIACSSRVVAAYRARGQDFVHDVCNAPDVLEKMTGLDALQRQTEEALQAWEDEGEDGDDF